MDQNSPSQELEKEWAFLLGKKSGMGVERKPHSSGNQNLSVIKQPQSSWCWRVGIPKSRMLNNSELSRKLQSIVLESGLATSPQIELLGEKWLCLVLCCTGGCYPLQMAVPELVPIYRFCSAYSSWVVRYHGACWTCLLTQTALQPWSMISC